MFKNLSLEKKIKIKTRISQIIFFLLTIISILGFYEMQKFSTSFINWSLMILAIAIIGLIFTELVRMWINNTIYDSIYNSIISTDSISSEAIKKASAQESALARHLQLIKEVLGIAEKLSKHSQQTRINSQKVNEKSQEILSMSSREHLAIKDNIEKMRILKQKIEIIAELILELSEHTQQIGSIIGVVEDITEQTNMLALNAAVEAARAGEHGKGFAVVASEIRKLADESKQATSKISSLIYDIQQATNSTVMATEEGTKEIESGVDLAYQIAQSIDVLQKIISDTVSTINEISTTANTQSLYSDEVLEKVDLINQGVVDSTDDIKQNIAILQNLVNTSKILRQKVLGEIGYKKA